MKMIYLLFLLAFLAAVGLFAYQNNRPETVTFWEQTWETSFPVVVGAAYLLGMLTGWTVVGLLRRSVRTVVHDLDRRADGATTHAR